MNLIKILILSLFIYIPLEEFILKWLPISINLFDLLHFNSDFLILVVIILYIYYNNFNVKIKYEDYWISIFLLSSIFSLIIFQPFIPYFFKVWVLIRYFLLYVVIRDTFNFSDYRKAYKIFYFIFYFQIAVGLIQFFNFSPLLEIFHPREGLDKAGNWFSKGEDGSAGTFLFTVHYGYFFFVSIGFIILDFSSKIKKYINITLCVMGSILSESLMSGLCSLLIAYIYFFRNTSKNKKLLLYITVPTIICLILILNLDSIIQTISSLMIFGNQFIIDQILFSRLGILKTFPQFFNANIFIVLFGFSVDKINISNFVLEQFNSIIPHVLRIETLIGLEDVYWSAHLHYFGLVGLTSYLMIMFSFRSKLSLISKSFIDFELTQNYRTIGSIIIFTVLAGFVNQIFSFKPFNIYFYLMISYAMFVTKHDGKQLFN